MGSGRNQNQEKKYNRRPQSNTKLKSLNATDKQQTNKTKERIKIKINYELV